MRYKHVIWDFDGTLFDTYPVMASAAAKTFMEAGLTEPKAEIMALMKISIGHAFDFYRKKHNLNEEFFDRLIKLSKAMEAEEAQLFDGAADVCRHVCEAGGYNYLFTHRGGTTPYFMEKFGLSQYFTQYVTSKDNFAKKPDPEGILHLIKRHNIPHESAIMIGDRDIDILSAKNAGIHGCFFDVSSATFKEANYNICHLSELNGILGLEDGLVQRNFMDITPIDLGWSGDKKLCATDTAGIRYFLRVSDIKHYNNRKTLFEHMQKVSKLDIPMCLPLEFGLCTDGVYALHSWIDGKDLQTVLPSLPESKQYALGRQAGEILRQIHTVPAPSGLEDWAIRFSHKLDARITNYRDCGLSFENDRIVIDFLAQNRCLLKGRPQNFQHGDYHIGNMMLEDGELRIIDFDRYDFGDPWEEFNRTSFSAAISPHFATGQLNGYFGGRPPMDFFRLMAFYIAANLVASLPWAATFGQQQVDYMLKRIGEELEWFDNMQNPVPTWYLVN